MTAKQAKSLKYGEQVKLTKRTIKIPAGSTVTFIRYDEQDNAAHIATTQAEAYVRISDLSK
jgi:hypothetical protein